MSKDEVTVEIKGKPGLAKDRIATKIAQFLEGCNFEVDRDFDQGDFMARRRLEHDVLPREVSDAIRIRMATMTTA